MYVLILEDILYFNGKNVYSVTVTIQNVYSVKCAINVCQIQWLGDTAQFWCILIDCMLETQTIDESSMLKSSTILIIVECIFPFMSNNFAYIWLLLSWVNRVVIVMSSC